MPMIWVWIINLIKKLAQAAEYAKHSVRNYTILESQYIPARNEKLYATQPRSNPRMLS
jgi:hypothetical protein